MAQKDAEIKIRVNYDTGMTERDSDDSRSLRAGEGKGRIWGEVKPRISWIAEDMNSLIIRALKVPSKVHKSESAPRHTVLSCRT